MMGKIAKAYQNTTSDNVFVKVITIIVILALTFYLAHFASPSFGSNTLSSNQKIVKAMTWNIAAINNNPFEYWITSEDPSYNKLMKDVSTFIENPGSYDIPVYQVFTDVMFNKLQDSMEEAGWHGVNDTRKFWLEDYRNRKIISEFIKDGNLGKKRLASMPDRVTNSINTVNEGVVTRPTVINCYSGDLGTMDGWFKQWREFIFQKKILVDKQGVKTTIAIKDLLTPIKKSKYPSISEHEERISLPLQTLCAAIFDAVLVHMMNQLAPANWQPLREEMCNKLNRRKTDRTIDIIQSTYGDNDIAFLQEVAGAFPAACTDKPISQIFDLYAPSVMDTDRDQNSFILLRKGRYSDVREVTPQVLNELSELSKALGKTAPVAKGDLLALSVSDVTDGTKYLLASFHGDTNGLATIPVVTAVYNYATSALPDHKLLFGMDANTYARPEPDQQGVMEFSQFYTSKKLNSCYGPNPNPFNFTTFHARTHLQTQLNKAVSLEEKDVKGDKNPKDFIVFFASDFSVRQTTKDNTGQKKFIENMIFPTLSFPSDHGVTSTLLVEVPNPSYQLGLRDSVGSQVTTSESRKMFRHQTTKRE